MKDYGLVAVSEELQPARKGRADRLRAKGYQLRHDYAERWGRLPDAGGAGAWHLRRAEGLDVTLVDRCRTCRTIPVAVVDAATGEVQTIWQGCKQVSCRTCERARARKNVKRISRSLDWVHRREIVRFAERDTTSGRITTDNDCRTVMLTLTVRHLDGWGPSDDAETMRRAWVLFRARWYYYFGFSFRFLRFEELAGGSEHDGHLHWHVVAWWPSFEWSGTFQRWWAQSVTRARNHQRPRIITDVDLVEGNVDVSLYNSSKSAAVAYSAKLSRVSESNAEIAAGYAAADTDSKNAIEIDKIQPARVADYLDFVYGRRRFATSTGLLPRESGPCRFYHLWRDDLDHEPVLLRADELDREISRLAQEVALC